MTTKAQRDTIEGHRKKFGPAHARIMTREVNKGKTLSQAHRTALRET